MYSQRKWVADRAPAIPWQVWLNASNDWIYRYLHAADARMVELARRFRGTRAEPTRRALEYAEQAGRQDDVAPELLAAQGLTDEAIDALVAERTLSKKQRNFARADQIRNELAEKGVVLEDSKDGVRWKRK